MRLESVLRDYYAEDISRLDSRLDMLAKEHGFPGGRVDLYCMLDGKDVAIELKACKYDSRRVAVQLLKYLGHFDSVWFVAPKVRYSVYASLKRYHPSRLSLFEVRQDLSAARVKPSQLDDSRPFPRLEQLEMMMPRRYPLLSFSWDVVRKCVAGEDLVRSVLGTAMRRYL